MYKVYWLSQTLVMHIGLALLNKQFFFALSHISISLPPCDFISCLRLFLFVFFAGVRSSLFEMAVAKETAKGKTINNKFFVHFIRESHFTLLYMYVCFCVCLAIEQRDQIVCDTTNSETRNTTKEMKTFKGAEDHNDKDIASVCVLVDSTIQYVQQQLKSD